MIIYDKNKTYQLDELVNQIICGDCFEVLKQIPDECVDLILTDPPYMISKETTISRGKNTVKFKGKDLVLDFGEWDHFGSFDEFMQWTYNWLDETARVLRKGGIFCSYFDKDKINFLSKYLQIKHKFKIKGYYADLKSNPVPQARKVSWMNGWEEIVYLQKPDGPLTYNYQLGQAKDWDIRSIVGHTTKEDGERFHPTQKPIKVISKFISYWSNENDIVLDPFLGSGTTAVAAINLGRRFIGIEKDKKFCEAAEERIKLAKERQSCLLFDNQV